MDQTSHKVLISTSLHHKKVLLITETGSELEKLISHGANVTLVISNSPSKSIAAQIKKHKIIHHVRNFAVADVKEKYPDMVFCYSNDPCIARLVFDVSQKIFVTCPNFPEYSNFHLVPQQQLGDLTVKKLT